MQSAPTNEPAYTEKNIYFFFFNKGSIRRAVSKTSQAVTEDSDLSHQAENLGPSNKE